MDWFFAINESSAVFDIYANLAKVAVYTALTHTSLSPYMLYDGGENAFTRWMRNHDVQIIPARTTFNGELPRLSEYVAPAHFTTLPGVFLRLELPRITCDLNINQTVLYTDCDVMFRRHVVADLRATPCRYFAVAGEFEQNDYYNINTGVMLMNLAALREIDAEFRAFIRAHFHEFARQAWDQGAYRRFFGWEREALLWDQLPPALNWKPYWGEAADAAIIHFHGPKPYEFERPIPQLLHLATPEYRRLSQEWMKLLEKAE